MENEVDLDVLVDDQSTKTCEQHANASVTNNQSTPEVYVQDKPQPNSEQQGTNSHIDERWLPVCEHVRRMKSAKSNEESWDLNSSTSNATPATMTSTKDDPTKTYQYSISPFGNVTE
jgi:hypothetical protein